jgi:hypothetical protein
MDFVNNMHTDDKTMTADPNLFPSIDFTQALEREERQQLLRNTNSSRASAEEQDSMFGEWPAGCLRSEMRRIQET